MAIQFLNNVNADSGVLYVDAVANRVGIGTTSPDHALDVVGSLNNTLKLTSSQTKSQILFEDTNTTDTVAIGSEGDNFNIRADLGDIRFQAGSERMRIDSSGNVGIGTTSPSYKLEVNSGTTNNVAKLESTDSTARLVIKDNSGEVHLSAIGNDMVFATSSSGSQRMRITSAGNVGIGTTSPQKLLDIENGGFSMFAVGGTSADTFSVVTHNYVFSDENEDAVYSYATSEHEFSTQGMPRVTIDSTGLVGIGTTSPGSLLHVSGGELDVSGGDGYKIEDKPWANWASDLLTLGDWDGEGYETRIMGANSSEVIRITGNNVGIGTTSPNFKLDIEGADLIRAFNPSGSASVQIKASTGNNSSVDFADPDDNNVGQILYRHANDSMSFDTNDIEKMRITSTGNVGIGTTSPGQKLDVSGNIKMTETAATTDTDKFVVLDSGVLKYRTGAEVLADIGAGTGTVTGSGTTNYIPKWSNSSTLTDSGIVETSTLTTINNASFEYDYSGTTYLNIDGTTGTFLLGQPSTTSRVYIHGIQNAIRFYVDNVKAGEFTDDQDFLVTNGNVGIGTASPTEKLEVAGAIKMSENSSYPLTIDHNSTTTTNEITTGGGLNIVSGSNNSISFKDATTTNMSISGYSGDVLMGYNTGKVGIGTTSPTDKLTVQNGNIRLNSTSSYPAQGLYAYWNSSSINMGSISWHNNPGFIGSEWTHYKQTSPYTLARIRLIGEASGGGMFVNLNSSDVFTILASNGNVGIGSTSPSYKLDVDGEARFGDNGGILLTDDSGTSYVRALNNHLNLRTTRDADDIYFSTGTTTTTKMFIEGDTGNVGIGTTSPSEKLEVDGIVKAVDGYKGYVSYFHNGGFFHSPRSTDGANPLWIPINSTGMSSSDQYYNTWVPLYAGRVRKIILKHISGSTPVATVCTFYKRINGTTSGTTYTGTVTDGGAVGMKVTFDFGTSNFTFNAEDEVQIGVVTGVATQPRMGGMSCQIWHEYNIT